VKIPFWIFFRAGEVITTRKAEHQLDDKMPREKPKDEKITQKGPFDKVTC
jgi:hypothetical protein